MIEGIANMIQAKYPDVNITGMVNKAVGEVRKKDLSKPGQILRDFGITENGINEIFEKHGSDVRAKAVLGLIKTTPVKERDTVRDSVLR